jgi:curved DNA-binding protein CbpA
MELIKLKEREVHRIEKVIRVEDYNPIDIFELEIPFDDKDIRIKYFKIIRLVHPDKNVSNIRFNHIFNVVNDNYKILNDKESKEVCIKSMKLKTKDILKHFFNKNIETTEEVSYGNGEGSNGQMILYNPMTLSNYVIKNNIQKNKYKVKVDIAMDGAEHTKNKSRSKSDKHQKGLKQRKTQKDNAESRILNHGFSFTDKVSVEEIKQYKDKNIKPK